MITSLGTHAFKAITPQTAITVDRARCVRHRCKHNECSKCIDICPTETITWDEQGLHVKSSTCTQCLRCLSVCPSAALMSPELSLPKVLNDLTAHPLPVLGCHRQPAGEAHAKLFCLGYLAHPELMLLLALIYTDGLQINLTHCQECPNGHILAGVHSAHERSLEVIPSHNLNLVCERSELGYQPSLFSRRDLFLFFRERSSRTVAVMLERLQRETQGQPYSSKQVPLVRAMLIKSMEPLLEEQRERIAEHLFGQVSFTSTCTACGGCSSVCPTGAIQPVEEDMQTPIFKHVLCVSCGSCQAFCRKNGVVLTTPINGSLLCS